MTTLDQAAGGRRGRMIVHGYFRSSAAYRLADRVWNLKGLSPEFRAGAPAPRRPEARRPSGAQPAGLSSRRSRSGTARCSPSRSRSSSGWTRASPSPPLLPAGPDGQGTGARLRALAIACDIHPLQNLRVLRYLKSCRMGRSRTALDAWCRHWVGQGLAACEALLAREPRGALRPRRDARPRRDLSDPADVLRRSLRRRYERFAAPAAPCAMPARRCRPSPTRIRAPAGRGRLIARLSPSPLDDIRGGARRRTRGVAAIKGHSLDDGEHRPARLEVQRLDGLPGDARDEPVAGAVDFDQRIRPVAVGHGADSAREHIEGADPEGRSVASITSRARIRARTRR